VKRPLAAGVAQVAATGWCGQAALS